MSDKTLVKGAIIENPLKNKKILPTLKKIKDSLYYEVDKEDDPFERVRKRKINDLLDYSLQYLTIFNHIIAFCKDYFTLDDPKELYLKEIGVYYIPNRIGGNIREWVI